MSNNPYQDHFLQKLAMLARLPELILGTSDNVRMNDFGPVGSFNEPTILFEILKCNINGAIEVSLESVSDNNSYLFSFKSYGGIVDEDAPDNWFESDIAVHQEIFQTAQEHEILSIEAEDSTEHCFSFTTNSLDDLSRFMTLLTAAYSFNKEKLLPSINHEELMSTIQTMKRPASLMGPAIQPPSPGYK